MGNPTGVRVCDAPDIAGTSSGIMAATPGECISAGSRLLPPAESMQKQTVTIECDGGHVGRVRITYQSKMFSYRRRSSYWAWLAVRVDRA